MEELFEGQVEVHRCTFAAHFTTAKVNIRFPSVFFMEWKEVHGRNAVSMVGRQKAQKTLITFNEELKWGTQMLYHKQQKRWLRKEALLHLNLISSSRPDQVKLVGRVLLDLAEVITSNPYSEAQPVKLMYCSVDAEVTFSLHLIKEETVSLPLDQLDRAAFGDVYTFNSGVRNTHSNNIVRRMKDTLSERKFEHAPVINSDIQQPSRLSGQSPKALPIRIEEHLPTPQMTPSPLTPEQPTSALIVERQGLEEELKQHQQKVLQLEAQIRQMMSQFQATEQQNTLTHSQLKEATSLAEQQEARISDLVAALEAAQQQLEQAQQTRNNETGNTAQLEKEVLQLRVNELEQSVAEGEAAKEQLRVAQQKLELLQKQIQISRAEVATLRQQVEQLKQAPPPVTEQKPAENVIQKQQEPPIVENVVKQKVIDSGEIDRLMVEIENRKQDIVHLKAELQDKHQILMDSNRRVKELEAQISTGKHTIIVQVPVIIQNIQSVQQPALPEQAQPVETAQHTEPVQPTQPAQHVSPAQPSQTVQQQERHVFNFDQHHTLTQDDIHQISEIKQVPENNQEEIVQLRDQNNKLKEEVEQLNKVVQLQREQIGSLTKKSEELIIASQEQLNSLKNNTVLQEEILNLKERLAQTESEKVEVVKQASKIEELQQQLSQSQRQIQVLEQDKHTPQTSSNQQHYMAELEQKIVSLEEELKIKEEMWTETERQAEENYALKYELAQLKEKDTELEAALEERDQMLSQLQADKNLLQKQLEHAHTTPNSEHLQAESAEVRPAMTDPEPAVVPADIKQDETAKENEKIMGELRLQIDGLKEQLIVLNNKNTDLRTQCEEINNQKNMQESTIEQLNAQIAHLDQTIAEMGSTQQLLTQQLQKSQEQIAPAAQGGDAQLLKEEISFLQKELQQQEEANVTSQTELAQQKDQITHLLQEMNSLREQSSKQSIQPPPYSFGESPIKVAESEKDLAIKPSIEPAQNTNQSTKVAPEQEPVTTEAVEGQGAGEPESAPSVDTLQRELETLRAELEQQKQAHSELISEHSILRQKYQTMTERHKCALEQVLQLNQENSSMSHQKHLFESQVQQLTAKIAQLQAQISAGASPVSDQPTQEVVQEVKEQQPLQEQSKPQVTIAAQQEQPIQSSPEQPQVKADKAEQEKEEVLPAEVQPAQNNAVTEPVAQPVEVKEEPIESPNKQPEIAKQQKPAESLIEQITSQQPAQPVQSVKPAPEAEPAACEVRVEVQEVTVVEAPVLTASERSSYEQQLSRLTQLESQQRNKVALLQENIASLEKDLMEQIELNQSEPKDHQSITALAELEQTHHQLKLQLERLQSENESLRVEVSRRPSETSENDQVQLMKERQEWQQKLEDIEQLLVGSESKHAAEKEALQLQVQTLQEQSAQPSQSHSNKTEEVNKQLQQLRAQKLSEMEAVARLQEEINNLNQKYAQKEVEMADIITQKDQEAEELKFVNHQLQGMQEEKQNQNNTQVEQFKQKYQALLKQHQELGAQLQNIKDERQNSSGELEGLTSELQKLQVEMASKVEQLAELEDSLAQADEELEKSREEVNSQKEIIESLNSQLTAANSQLNTAKTNLDTANNQVSQLQVKVDANSKLESVLQSLKEELKEKEREGELERERRRQKQAEIIELGKQADKWKGQCRKHELTIQQLAQKEKGMKETVDLIESESQKMVDAVNSRLQGQEKTYQQAVEQEKRNQELVVSIASLREALINEQRVSQHHEETAQQLRQQLVALQTSTNSAQDSPDKQINAALAKTNQDLLARNKEYLELINQQSGVTVDNQRLRAEHGQLNNRISQLSSKLEAVVAIHENKAAEDKVRSEVLEQHKEALEKEVAELKLRVEEARTAGKEEGQQKLQEMLMQKNEQINEQAAAITKLKEKAKEDKVKEQSEAASNGQTASILNHQIMKLNEDILTKDAEINRLKEQTIPTPQNDQAVNQVTVPKDQADPISSKDIGMLCNQIKQACNQRRNFEESKGLFNSFVEKYEQIEERFSGMGGEAGSIQEKARTISKEMQKLKAFVIKSQKAMKEKTEFLALLKPCQKMASEIVSMAEVLSHQESQTIFAV